MLISLQRFSCSEDPHERPSLSTGYAVLEGKGDTAPAVSLFALLLVGRVTRNTLACKSRHWYV